MAAVKIAGVLDPATELRLLARKRVFAGRRTELRSLADAVDQQIGAERWSAVDLFAAFRPDDLPVNPYLLLLGRLIDICVQVLFFAPIFVTWLGLLNAVRAYREMVHLGQLTQESFLEGWQSGFNHHLSSSYYLDQIAFDVVLLIGVLVVSLIIQFAYRTLFEEEFPGRLNQRLTRALTAADLQLAPYRQTAPNQLASELQKAAAEFQKTAQAVKDVGDTARSLQATAKSSQSAANAALAKVNALAKAAVSATAGIEKASAGLGSNVAGMSSATSAAVTAEKELIKQVGQSSTQLSGSIDSFVSRLSESMQKSRDSIELSHQQMTTAADSSSAKIAEALQTGADKIREAMTELAVAGTAYVHRVEQAADLIGQAGDSVDAIPGAVSSFKTELAGAISGFGSDVAGLSSALGGLERAIMQARSAVPSAQDVPPGLKAAGSDLKAAATALQAAASTLHKIGEAPLTHSSPAKRRVPDPRPGQEYTARPRSSSQPTAAPEPESEQHAQPGPAGPRPQTTAEQAAAPAPATPSWPIPDQEPAPPRQPSPQVAAPARQDGKPMRDEAERPWPTADATSQPTAPSHRRWLPFLRKGKPDA